MDPYHIPPLLALLSVGAVGWFLMRCGKAFDDEARRVERR